MDNNVILTLKKLRPLFTYMAECPDKVLKDLASILPSKHMIFPCDIIDLRHFLINDKIFFTNPIPLFSQRFAEKYLKGYSLFIVLDSEKTGVKTHRYGGLQLNFCEELNISKLIVRIIINEPAAAGAFDVVKNLIKEFDLGVECLVSNSVPGISGPAYRLSGGNVIIHKTAEKSELPLNSKEKQIFEFLRTVKRNHNLNIQMRVAGGWVRDKLLGKESDDIDIAVNMPGYDFAQIVATEAAKQGITNDPKAYNVSLDKTADPSTKVEDSNLMVGAVNLLGQKIEFVPMRTEYYPDSDSRKPKITTTNDVREDVKRRDLTINALYYNIDTGQIDDIVGGRRDLGLEGDGRIILRTPDETKKTYMEDPLRLLRALRFHSCYPNSILDPQIIKSMSDPEIQEAYSRKVATERAGPEIMKMMMGENPVSSVKMLFDSGLYKKIFNVPSMENISEEGINMEQQTPFHKYNLKDHTVEVLQNLNKIMKGSGEDDYMRGLMNIAALFHDFGKMQKGIQKPHPTEKGRMQYIGHEMASAKMADQILKSIGVSKDDRDIVNQVVRLHMRPHSADRWGSKGRGKFLRETKMHGKDEEHKDLWKYVFYHARADEMSSQPDNFDEEKHQKMFDNFSQFVESPSGSFRGTVLNGRDIMKVFPELNPSTGFIREVLNFIKEKQDEGVINVVGEIENARQEAFKQIAIIAPNIISKYKVPEVVTPGIVPKQEYNREQGENKMGSNWFKKIKISQVAPLSGIDKNNDPEVKHGPKPAKAKYQRGMTVRDRRKSVSQSQNYGKVESIQDGKVKIIWNPDQEEKRREEIFDMVENTEILSLIVEEV